MQFLKFSRFAAILTVVGLSSVAVSANAQVWSGVNPPVNEDSQGTFQDGSDMGSIGVGHVTQGKSIIGGGAFAFHDADNNTYHMVFDSPTLDATGDTAIFSGGSIHCDPPLPPGTTVTITYSIWFSDMSSSIKQYEYKVPDANNQP